ncbi:lysis protein [Pseudomonas fragi]|uniref:lysis protein n=1 Tax=Pseudomonas fragi TaxID=296 RepID=UPI0021C167C7|nr:lysis protein [Pseudomonas fragi]UXL40538.1 lysis protein [Pseudomonas fragi]
MSALPTNLLSLVAFLAAWFLFNHLIDERNSAKLEVVGLREAARISGEMLADRDENDRTRTEELNHALSKNADLQRDVADGRQRLRINATCPVAKASPGSVADAGTAELAADARSDYFTLRNQLALSREMILGLQDHVRRICQR